jgi:peroxiredoxin
MRFVFTSARVDYNILSTVFSYADCIATDNSFYWDNINQVAYFHLTDHPHTYTSMDMSALYGTTYGRPVEFNGLMYPNILLTKPTVERSVEPLVYQKIGAQTLDIELINDELWGIDTVTHKPFRHFRFDDTSGLNGQVTYLRYGEDGETDYSKLKVLHKGIITNIRKSGTRLYITCDDVRSKRDAEWPTLTYQDAGYTVEHVGEEVLTTVIPDGFGYNENMELVCVNKDVAVLPVDDDDNMTQPSNLISNTMTGWTKVGAEVTKITSMAISKITSYRVAKTAASSSVTTLFTPAVSRIRVYGYIMCDDANVPTGNSIIALKKADNTYLNELWIKFADKSFVDASAGNCRVKFVQNEDGQITASYSFEVNVPAGVQCQCIVFIDYDQATTTSAVFMTPPIIQVPAYPKFRVARKLSSSTVHVYYEEDDELIEVTNVVSVDQTNGIITLHDVDVHEEGLISNGLRKLYCSATLRAETNPFDIITVLNAEAEGIPYIASFYDIDTCVTEKAKLAPVSLYANSTQKLNAVIEQLQSGSTVGFRYDDVDKISIVCDDPNRPISRVIEFEEIIDREDLELESDLTLYADEVTINYGVDRKTSTPYKERNSDYKASVLLRYSYTNPLTYESLLVTQADARNKSIVLLEDLSVVRDKTSVKVHGLSILSEVDLYSIVRVNLRLTDEREFAGWMRMQVIGIIVDTDYEFVTLQLRQRDYSLAFEEVTGQYGEAIVVGDSTENDEIVLGFEDGEASEVIGHVYNE